MKAQWERPIEANVDIEAAEWQWLRTPLVQIMTEVEKHGLRSELLMVMRRGFVVEVRAYYPSEWDDQSWMDAGCPAKTPEFESGEWCTECRRPVREPHDIEYCKVQRVMES
jgi:hypothetical protein